MQKKLKARILSLALSAVMVASITPTTVFATEGGNIAPGASSLGEIQSFDKLDSRFEPSTGKDAPGHIYSLTVEVNTPEEDLRLPAELTAMVARTTTVSTPSDTEDGPVVDSGKTDGDEVAGEDKDAQEKEKIKDGDVPLAPERSQDEETTVTTVEQETVPVTWSSDKEYKSDTNGQFIYTAEISEDYNLADGVKLPQIYVAVGKQARVADTKEIIVDGNTYSLDLSGLQAAFDAAASGDTVKLGGDVIGIVKKLKLNENKSITLDLNGNDVICEATASVAIEISDKFILTVTDTTSDKNGTLKATGDSSSAISSTGTGTVNVLGGTVEASGKSGCAISNESTGTVNVSGGTVEATGESGTAIRNRVAGTVHVSGGTVQITDKGRRTIENRAAGTVNISGGTVEATGNNVAIENGAAGPVNISGGTVKAANYSTITNSKGKITISGVDTLVTSQSERASVGTITLLAPPSPATIILDIQGGTVSNTADPENYSVYFTHSSVTFANLPTYYSHTGGTVGKVYPESAAPPSPHKPVTNITDVPTTAVAGTDLTLTGTVAPTDATNKTIAWSVKDAGATGATISGTTLKTTAEGTVTVTATITNGATASSNYTQDFTITVNAPKTPASIAVTTAPTKTAYTTGETFNKAGMVVTATYTDNTTAAVSGYTFSPNTALTTTDTTITISYTENGTTVTTTQAITVTDAPTPDNLTITINGGSNHQVSSGKDMTFTCSGKLEDLEGIYVDGKLVDKSNYNLKSGSTILTLKASYLDTLSVGKHTLKFQYKDNVSAETNFTITAKAGETPTTKPGSPQTGDSSNLIALFTLLLASGGTLALLARRRKTGRHYSK